MGDYGWIKELTAAGAIVFFCYLLLRAILSRADKLTNAVLDRSQQDSATIKEMSDDISVTLRDIEQSMVNRDVVITNHMDHFESTLQEIVKTQLLITNILTKVCTKFDINGGGK